MQWEFDPQELTNTVWALAVAVTVATSSLVLLLGIGVVQLFSHLIKGVREVNRCGAAADTTPWQLESRDSEV